MSDRLGLFADGLMRLVVREVYMSLFSAAPESLVSACFQLFFKEVRLFTSFVDEIFAELQISFVLCGAVQLHKSKLYLGMT